PLIEAQIGAVALGKTDAAERVGFLEVRLWPAEVVREDYRDKSVPLLERMHSRWRAASWRRRASRPLSLPTRSRCCSSPTAQHPPDRRLAHSVHLHQVASGCPVGEQAPRLVLLLLAEGCALRL